ncbi:MAG: hypothetical protein EAX96_14620 [Candidatus Lokiarchaeota archaeon]|nr:hypothetical protein [Candidatus Lokiarchaeota archaeon]
MSFLAKRRGVAKSVIVRELLLKGLTTDLLPILLKDYQEGKVSLKKIITLTKLAPIDVFKKIADTIEDPPISSQVDDYTSKLAEEIFKQWKNDNK